MTRDLYNPNPATQQALGLVRNWFFETGAEHQMFGPDEPITKEVMHESGVDQFREAWAESGYKVPFSTSTTIDQRKGPLPVRLILGAGTYIKSHVIDLGLSTMGLGSDNPEGSIDAINGTIGSLDTISVDYADNGLLKISVHNTMGLASFSRIPGTDYVLMDDEPRSARRIWGGTITQEFYWFEKRRAPKNGFEVRRR